jgi:superfamily II DNA or RNA helicase
MIESLILASAPTTTISYYIGGMKDAEREAGAATAQVLLASYAMASEAMNIKTLNTVVLASPRKNVEQSTGRILRVRPDQRQVHPVIVDIVDVHTMYRSQWKKRGIYYRKCSYNITGDPTKHRQTKEQEQETETETETETSGCLIVD